MGTPARRAVAVPAGCDPRAKPTCRVAVWTEPRSFFKSGRALRCPRGFDPAARSRRLGDPRATWSGSLHVVLSSPTADAARVDPLLQFILAVAGQQDEVRDRELGPIHLLKYAYLADLAHSEIHEGRTFTAVPWHFHHFGPWSPAIFERVEPALTAVGAERKVLNSARYDDFVRYSLSDERLLDRLDAALPSAVVSAVRHAVREFGSDTASLLRHVYLTRPILHAAPGELLTFDARRGERLSEFAAALTARSIVRDAELLSPDASPKLSWKALKEKRETFLHRRQEIRAQLAQRVAKPRAPVIPAPRYDEVYFDGVKQLDELAGPPPTPLEGEAVFSDDIWKSPTRSDRDVP